MRLTDEELRLVLARAEEIERTTRHGDDWNAEIATVIGAAEEVGLSRQAVERALAERRIFPATKPVVGALTWARSIDGRFYVAEVLSVSDEDTRVRFLRGSEHVAAPDELRPCAFLPGERVVCDWPMWGRWTATLVQYDTEKQRVTLSDGWGETNSFPLAGIWLEPEKLGSAASRRYVYARLLAIGATVGALLGAAVTALLMR